VVVVVLVDGSNTDDKVAIVHSGMFDSDGKFISGLGKDSDEIDVVIRRK
jgi:hypothetical protein